MEPHRHLFVIFWCIIGFSLTTHGKSIELNTEELLHPDILVRQASVSVPDQPVSESILVENQTSSTTAPITPMKLEPTNLEEPVGDANLDNFKENVTNLNELPVPVESKIQPEVEALDSHAPPVPAQAHEIKIDPVKVEADFEAGVHAGASTIVHFGNPADHEVETKVQEDDDDDDEPGIVVQDTQINTIGIPLKSKVTDEKNIPEAEASSSGEKEPDFSMAQFLSEHDSVVYGPIIMAPKIKQKKTIWAEIAERPCHGCIRSAMAMPNPAPLSSEWRNSNPKSAITLSMQRSNLKTSSLESSSPDVSVVSENVELYHKDLIRRKLNQLRSFKLVPELRSPSGSNFNMVRAAKSNNKEPDLSPNPNSGKSQGRGLWDWNWWPSSWWSSSSEAPVTAEPSDEDVIILPPKAKPDVNLKPAPAPIQVQVPVVMIAPTPPPLPSNVPADKPTKEIKAPPSDIPVSPKHPEPNPSSVPASPPLHPKGERSARLNIVPAPAQNENGNNFMNQLQLEQCQHLPPGTPGCPQPIRCPYLQSLRRRR